MMSQSLSIEIIHVFPGRGHSYCVCDRNFGRYVQQLKRKETIETVQEYVDTIKSSRKEPFIMVDGAHGSILGDYDTSLHNAVQRAKSVRISTAVTVVYKHSGSVVLSSSYTNLGRQTYPVKCNMKLADLQLQKPPVVGLAPAKRKDVLQLLRYVSAPHRSVYEEYLSAGLEQVEDGSDVDESDLEY